MYAIPCQDGVGDRLYQTWAAVCMGRAKPARIPITTNRIEKRQERETPIANARRCHRLFVEFDEKVALLDADVFDAISEGFPKAVLGPKFADQVDIFQAAEPGIR